MLAFGVLGPLEAAREGEPLSLGAAKQQALLALLLLEAGRAVSTRRLAAGIWGEEPPRSAPKALQLYVSQLRKLLGAEAIETRRDGYLLRARGLRLDLAEFERLAQAGRSQATAGRPREAAARLAEALSLWRGEPLEGLDEPGLLPLQARLAELRLVVSELSIDARLSLGEHAELVPELLLLSARHPLRERLHEQLMLALYRDGQQAEALATFRRLRGALHEQLGLEPRPALRELEQEILRHDGRLAAPRAQEARRTLLAAGPAPDRLAALCAPLARSRGGELVLLSPLERRDELERASARLDALRADDVRVAAFVSADPEAEVARFAAAESAELLVLAAERASLAAPRAAALRRLGCDLVLFVDGGGDLPGEAIGVLFGGSGEDWKALEFAASLARACARPLRLLGAARGARDASSLLARAALVVQRFAGVATAATLFEPEREGALAAAAAGGVLVAGAGEVADAALAPGRARLGELGVPLCLLCAGPGPGLLAPREALTRFSWSLRD